MKPRPGICDTPEREPTEEPFSGGEESSVERLQETRHGGGVGEEGQEVEGVHESGTGYVQTHYHEHEAYYAHTLANLGVMFYYSILFDMLVINYINYINRNNCVAKARELLTSSQLYVLSS